MNDAQIIDILNTRFSGQVRDVTNPAVRRIFFTVEPKDLLAVVGGLKEAMGLWFLSTISGVDAGESFEIVYHFGHDHGNLNLRTRIPKADPHVESITRTSRGDPLRTRAPGHVRNGHRSYPRPASSPHVRRLAGRELPPPQGLEVRAARGGHPRR